VRTRPTILFFSPDGCPVPSLVRQWAAGHSFPLLMFSQADDVESIVLRGHPCLLFVDGDHSGQEGMGLVRRLKSDAFTAIVPVTTLSGTHHAEEVQAWFACGSDEVITGLFTPAEQRARLDSMLVRTERDVSVHPSTRLPGTTEIERDIRRRLESDQEFAVCYADLDHFKEFNDRYSYYEGDRVIYILSRILHDVVKGLMGQRGFVGHIGGDDFIFIIPAADISPVCSEILEVFDALIPLQYNDQDRRAGYFFGKDRRGQLHRVPLMTLSIGIVTNRHRRFAHPAQVSELATEMKSYAKTLPGSVFVVDRRHSTDGGERPGPGSRELPRGP
jgi:GGDEF domain-containing protein